jgi:hypothetical protein
MYKEFLGRFKSSITVFTFLITTYRTKHSVKCTPLKIALGEWHEENMDINYVQENPKAMLRHEHAASMRLQLEETLGTFNGYFFVTLYLNAAVQRVTFGYVTRTSTFNDVRFRLHILQPFSLPGNEPSNYFNFNTFVMPRRLCYSRNCQCPLQHTELIEYSKILTIAVAETNAGNKVHTVGIVDALSNDENAVFQFKGSYEDQELSKYKSIRVKLHSPYTI